MTDCKDRIRNLFRKTGSLTALSAGLAVLLGTFHPAGAQDSSGAAISPEAQELVEAAREEGTVSVFGIALNPDQVDTIAERFNDFYGTSLDVTMTTGLHPAKVAELVQGGILGVPSGIDLFWSVSDMAAPLSQAELVQPVDWVEEVGADPDLLWADNALRLRDGTLGLVIYNTDLISPEDAPRTYQDLLDPKYQGLIGMPRSPALAYVAHAIGEAETEELLVGLIEDQNVRRLPSYPDVRARVLSGELAIGIGIDAFVDQRNGAPVAHAPIEPVVVVPWAGWVMADAKSPNASKLFAYWLSTPDGQQTLDEVAGFALITSDGTLYERHVEDREIVIVPHEYLIEENPRISRRHMEIMGQ